MKDWRDFVAKVVTPILAAVSVAAVNGYFQERAEKRKAEERVYETLDSYKAYIECVMRKECEP